MTPKIEPSLDTVRGILHHAASKPNPPNLVPLSATLSSEFLTPSSIYLKLSARAKTKLNFLFESAMTTQTISRWSYVGIDARKVLRSGPGEPIGARDPLPALQEELSHYRVASIPELQLPPLIGGAIGYVGYDCIAYFEPRTARDDMKDVLQLPESMFMLFDTVVAVDHFFQVVKVCTYIKVPEESSEPRALEAAYAAAEKELHTVLDALSQPGLPLPHQGPIELNREFKSNIGQTGYENHVTRLKEHIRIGDIIQAVPSQRMERPTDLHPFNIYRRLRSVNPSPYLFFVDCDEFQIVGASPEVLVKIDEDGRVVTHPIAGTVKRGKTKEEDDKLANELAASVKDRAEHVMLVDLARNDVNRVCDPLSTRVDKFMIIQRFSHVQHMTSEVSGVLRPDKTVFDAFRSIFPAGTVSGAPKVKAMELISELEREKRGIYGGAVGYFGYSSVKADGTVEEGSMNMCLALRTMVVKDGVAFLQAGGGIVHDSVEKDEYFETINKLKSNMTCIESAEDMMSEQAVAAAPV